MLTPNTTFFSFLSFILVRYSLLPTCILSLFYGSNSIHTGRGKSIAHKGNARFRQLINQRKNEYQAARRREDKTRLTIEIVHELRKTSRFLLKDPKLQLWFEVGEDYMKEKVSHALRSRPNDERRKRPKAPNNNRNKKALRGKPQLSPAIDCAVESLIQEQQALLKSMIERENAGSSSRSSGGGAATLSLRNE